MGDGSGSCVCVDIFNVLSLQIEEIVHDRVDPIGVTIEHETIDTCENVVNLVMVLKLSTKLWAYRCRDSLRRTILQ